MCRMDLVTRIAESLVEIVAPHARGEEMNLQAGEPVHVVPDAVPWSAHVALWQG